MGRFLDRFKKIAQGHSLGDIKRLEEEAEITKVIIKFCQSPEWQHIEDLFLDEMGTNIDEQRSALEKDKTEKAIYLAGDIGRLWKIISLSRDAKTELNSLDNEIKLNKEAKNG